jgi:hypothetical protein
MVHRPDFDSLSFHEATVLRVSTTPTRLEVELAGVGGWDAFGNVVVEFDDVTGMSRDGASAGEFQMERQDGEVLTLGRDGDEFVLIVEWNDFSPRSSHTTAWRWRAQASVRASKQ